MIGLEVDLIISGESLDPALISQRLAVQPDEQQRKGDPHIDPSGRRFADRKVGLWSISSQLPESASLQEHIQSILNRMGDSVKHLKELKAAGFDVYVFVGGYISKGNGMFTLDTPQMKGLSEAGIDIDFDVYSND